MKASKLLLAAALLAGLATLGFAGPSPQFWAQQAKNQQTQAVKADGQDKAQVASCDSCTSCACCAAMKKA